jgi:excisionase family DNA binding protein
MHRRLQFGMRENPASSRRHGSRQAPSSLSDASLIEEETATSPPTARGQNHSFADADIKANAASPQVATGGEKKKSENESRAAAVALARSQKATPGFEPLIGSLEAAKLLGNIHIKTLQRYARHQRVPGYQIGGHWYFRASELDSWLRSRLNSNCQSADRVDFTQEKN